MTASNVSLGSQAVGVVGPVGWTGVLEGPEIKKRLTINISPGCIFDTSQVIEGSSYEKKCYLTILQAVKK